MSKKRLALVYDRINKWGGAERILLVLKKMFPQAPLYTSVYLPQKSIWARNFQVKVSFLNRFPGARIHHEFYPWLTPLAFESFDFSNYDLVISVTSAEAKGIITKPEALHICYCLTPTRYLWTEPTQNYQSLGFGRLDFLAKMGKSLFTPWLSRWDRVAAYRPDYYLAISKTVQKRIKKYYHRDSEVIYPPLNLDKFRAINNFSKSNNLQNSKFKLNREKFFLVVSRLVPYKKIDLVIEVFNELKWPLKIIGTGVELGRLKKIAGPKIEFLGKLTDKELISYYYACEAVICPQEEDFGLVSLEAQACGKPVISYQGGGALETIIRSKTGEFFYPQTAKALREIVLGFKPNRYDPVICQKNTNRFNQNLFINKFNKIIKKIWQEKPMKK